MWISQTVPLANIYPGGEYEVALDYKSNTPLGNGGMGFRLQNNTMDIQIPLPSFPGDGLWYTFTSNFTIPTDAGSTNPEISFHFCRQGIADWWIDNISITKIN